MGPAFSQSALKAFGDAVQSLKLYRRAELRDQESAEPLVGKLYVDPLQNEAVLETMLRPNTTFIVGRKGTGKSTVFQRAQHEIRKRKRALSAYVDIKTVFESAEVDQRIADKLAAIGTVLSAEEIQRILIYRAFTKATFVEIQKELRSQLDSSILQRFKESLGARRNEVIESINDLLEGNFEADVTDITAITAAAVKSARDSREVSKAGTEFTAHVGMNSAGAPTIKGGIGSSSDYSAESGSSQENQYSKVLLRTFNINSVMEKLEQVLSTIGVDQLYIFIDDFSELPQEAMIVFVDSVLAPLNNWSNEMIKFKVAAYPGRLYLGKIDKSKIDEIYLDTFRLYGSSDVNSMEEKAIDFTRRLIDNRLNYFVGHDLGTFCDGDVAEIYRQLFFASMGNARILGHLLHNLREAQLVYGHRIGVRAVQGAAAKYYEDKVEPFFGIQKFVHETYGERSSIFSLKELLETMVERARELKSYKDSTVTRDIPGRTPSSHFHVLTELESLLSTLELNFFLTKYYEMKDRDGRKVSIYALNYGLCAKYSIAFGRPEGRREYRLYYVERIFDYSSILKHYLESNQEIRCENCGALHDLSKLESLRLFDMLCPACKSGKCHVTNLSRKYESMIRQIDPQMLLPPNEMGILETLYVENRELAAAEIAEELDCSYQLVGKRGKIMEERGLVSRAKNDRNRRMFKITDTAVTGYFRNNEERLLKIKEEGE